MNHLCTSNACKFSGNDPSSEMAPLLRYLWPSKRKWEHFVPTFFESICGERREPFIVDMPPPSLFERSRTRLNGPHRGALHRQAFTHDAKFFLNGVHHENFVFPQQESSSGTVTRVRVGGKFLFLGNDKFWVRGVTYGAFKPDPNGQEYHEPT